MNFKSVVSFKPEEYKTISIITDANGIDTVKADFPEIAPFIDTNIVKFDNESIATLTLVIKNELRKVHILGLNEDNKTQDLLNAFGLMAKKFTGEKAESVICHIQSIAKRLEIKENLVAAIKGLINGCYEFNQYQTNPKSALPNVLSLYLDSEFDLKDLEDACVISNGILLARRLVDEPANLMTPAILAEKAQEALAGTNVEVEVFEEDKIKELDMNLFLAVAKGSVNRPRLIVMRYNGNPESSEKIGLIGKGLTYDTGGYSIKPTNGMITMKCDMGGSAAVIGAMTIIAAQQPKVNVVAVVAACENRISDNAFLPGDILKSKNGKTVEINNTDAEGRLTLADAMTYAIREENATKVTDICTLTGACVIALGEEFAGVVTWEDSIWNKVDEAAKATLEPCWRLPLNKTFQKKNHSKMADLKNSAERPGGSITAGSFVGEFSEGKPWVHFDIAGTAYIEHEKPHLRTGGTGFGAHLLAEFVKTF